MAEIIWVPVGTNFFSDTRLFKIWDWKLSHLTRKWVADTVDNR